MGGNQSNEGTPTQAHGEQQTPDSTGGNTAVLEGKEHAELSCLFIEMQMDVSIFPSGEETLFLYRTDQQS